MVQESTPIELGTNELELLPPSHEHPGPAASFADSFARFIVAWRFWLLAGALALVAIAYGPSSRLEFDRSIENMFAEDDAILVPYQQLKRTFGGDEVVLAAYVDPKLMTPEGMARVAELTAKLAAVDGVENVLSLTSTPLGADIIHRELPLSEPFLKLFEGYAIGTDQQTTGIICTLRPEDQTDADRTKTVDELRRLTEAHDKSGVLTGGPVMVVDGFRYIEEDGALLGRAATILLMVAILVCFRSVRWMIVPIAVVNVTLLWTEALLVMSGLRLSMVSSMLWAIVTVCGIAAVMHVLIRFREQRHLGYRPREALLTAAATVAMPVAFAILTDAAGFGSLMAARVGPVQDFGTMMALASLVAIVSVSVVLPGLALWGHVDTDPKRAWGEGQLDLELHRIVRWVERWPKSVAALSIAIVGVATTGYLWLDVETDFTRNFRESSPIVKSYAFVETNLGGAGVWDTYVPAPPKLDWEFVDRLARLESRLRREVVVRDADGRLAPGLTKTLSLADALGSLSMGSLRDSFDVELLLEQMESQLPILKALRGRDPQTGQNYVRIMLRARERQPSDQKNQLIQQVTSISRSEFPGAQVTGFFVLLTNLIDSMIRDQWITFAIATGTIGLMMMIVFRSVALALVGLVPNVLPNITVIGLMGWFNLKLNMGAAMIAAVSMGLAVDSSTHYIIEFLRARRRGLSLHEAIDRVHQSVGRANVFSTMAIVIGFSALCLSQFVPIIYFGVLVNLSILGGLGANLVLLPLLLRLVCRDPA